MENGKWEKRIEMQKPAFALFPFSIFHSQLN